jgi:hypothetical protein
LSNFFILDAKRLVGRSFAQIEKKVEFWPFKVVADDDGAAVVKVGKNTYKPEVNNLLLCCQKFPLKLFLN